MSDSDITNALTRLGVRESEARFYLELVKRTELTAGELHRLTGVNRPRTYAILTEMLSRGFVRERVAEKHRYYSAVPPLQLLERAEAELERQRRAARDTYGLLEDLFNQGREEEHGEDRVQVIRNKEQIQRSFLRLYREAREEVLCFNRSPYAVGDPGFHEEQQRAGEEGVSRGVRFRTLNMMEPEQLPWLYPGIKQLLAMGVREIRVVDELPVKMFVFDRRRVMLALPVVPGQPTGDFSMVLLEDPGFAAACILLFEGVWSRALSLEEWERQSGFRLPTENGKEPGGVTHINLSRTLA